MKKYGTILVLLASIAFGAAAAAASNPAPSSQRNNKAETGTPQFKATPATAFRTASNPHHLFPVNDQRGLLLTCIAPEIDTNIDTDVFNNCTLAPGRTLDDVMHSFIAALHYVQKVEMEERAESQKESEERSNQKAGEK